MQAFRLVMLLVALAAGYLLFFRSQPPPAALPPAGLTVSTDTKQTAPIPRTQYKEAMDRAQVAAQAMREQRKDADSF